MDQSFLERYINSGLSADISFVDSIIQKNFENKSFANLRLDFIHYEKIKTFADNVKFTQETKHFKADVYDLQIKLQEANSVIDSYLLSLKESILQETTFGDTPLLHKKEQYLTLVSDLGLYDKDSDKFSNILLGINYDFSKKSSQEKENNLMKKIKIKKYVKNSLFAGILGAACILGISYLSNSSFDEKKSDLYSAKEIIYEQKKSCLASYESSSHIDTTCIDSIVSDTNLTRENSSPTIYYSSTNNLEKDEFYTTRNEEKNIDEIVNPVQEKEVLVKNNTINASEKNKHYQEETANLTTEQLIFNSVNQRYKNEQANKNK